MSMEIGLVYCRFYVIFIYLEYLQTTLEQQNETE